MKRSLLIVAMLTLATFGYAQTALTAKSMKDAGVLPLSNTNMLKSNILNEGFETFVPPSTLNGWTIIQTNANETWDTASYSPNTGLRNMHCEYDAAVALQQEYLVTPTYDFSAANKVVVKFWWNGSKYWSVTPYNNCDLFFVVRTNAGAWSAPVWSEETDTTWTTWEWRQDSVVLDASYFTANVQIGFEYHGTDGAEMSLDDVTIDTTAGAAAGIQAPLTSEFTRISPNPADNYLRLESSENIKSVKMYNTVGSLVLSASVNAKTSSIDISTLPEGLYYVEMQKNNSKESRKIVISR